MLSTSLLANAVPNIRLSRVVCNPGPEALAMLPYEVRRGLTILHNSIFPFRN